MRALLDVNVLVALFDPDHTFHERAHAWFQQEGKAGWSSCPLTENGVVRVLSHPEYSHSLRLSAASVIASLEVFCGRTDHEFWADDITVRDGGVFLRDRIHGARQLTDLYLLGLATNRRGRLVTFDHSIPRSAVPRATAANLHVI